MRIGMVGGAVLSGSVLLGLAACSPATSDDAGATGQPSVSPAASPRPSAEPVRRAKAAKSVLPPEAPVAATLPSGVVVPIRAVSTTSDGELDVPDDTEVAAWWRGGSRLGDPFGSILVAAHIDSTTQGLGPFAELLTVEQGDRVVLGSAHLTQEFEVEARRLVTQGPLGDEQWLFEATGTHRLTLVTCAPPYDRDRGGYQNLAVVTAVPVTAPWRARSR